jgi:hypothetical protein
MAQDSISSALGVEGSQPCGTDVIEADVWEGNDARADRALLDRCLAGDVSAWEKLYGKWHTPLCVAIKSLVSARYCDPNLIEEIAGRVWYALLRSGGELFDQFNPALDLRLGAFLRGVARVEVMRYFRAEHRRRIREDRASQIRPRRNSPLCDWQFDATLSEFTATLTPRERQFLKEHLLSRPTQGPTVGPAGFSYANTLQQRHRIRTKLKAFLGS